MGTPAPGEVERREEIAAVREVYRPGDAKPELPGLAADSSLDEFLLFAMLSNPAVEAAYYDWAAAVERITVARSRPDPRLTFEFDVADFATSLMAGLMTDLPGPGKLRLAGEAAAEAAGAGYHGFAAEVLRAALAVKRAYYRLGSFDETLRIEKESLEVLRDLEAIARSRNAAGLTTLQDVLRAQIDMEELTVGIANLTDSRAVLVAEFKAALGLPPEAPDPPVPATIEPSADPPPPEDVLAVALRDNPGLAGLAAGVERAAAMLKLARAGRAPDFSAGVDVGLGMSPVTWSPSVGVTLPIWRDRIAAEIAAAEAEKRGASARLSAARLQLAAEIASLLYLYRESTRDVALLAEALLPRARQSLTAARAGYTTGRSTFLDLLEARRTLLRFQLAEVAARTQRELVLAELSLAVMGVAPRGAPLLAEEDKP